MYEERPCEVCGLPTTSELGVCQRRGQPACRAEYHRRLRKDRREVREQDGPKCEVCGGPLGPQAVIPICLSNPECRRKHKAAEIRVYQQRRKDRGLERVRYGEPERKTVDVPCEVCGQPTTSSLRVCRATKECDNEYQRRYKERQREEVRA